MGCLTNSQTRLTPLVIASGLNNKVAQCIPLNTMLSYYHTEFKLNICQVDGDLDIFGFAKTVLLWLSWIESTPEVNEL